MTREAVGVILFLFGVVVMMAGAVATMGYAEQYRRASWTIAVFVLGLVTWVAGLAVWIK